MKKAAFIILLVVGVNPVYAQFEENNAIFIGNEFNFGGYLGIDINLNYLYGEKYSARLGYTTNTRIARSIPSDYSPGIIGIFTLGANTPHDNFSGIHIDFGYIIKLNDAGTARMNMSLGLGFVTTKEPVNWQKTDGFMTENYTWDYEKNHMMSFVVNPKFEFPFSRYYGMSVSPMVQFHEGGVFFAIGIGHIFGLLRKSALPATQAPEIPLE